MFAQILTSDNNWFPNYLLAVSLRIKTTKSEESYWKENGAMRTRFKFPSKCMRGKQRKFNHTWLNNKFLRYSISQDTVYCIPCVLFGSEKSGNSQGGMFGSPKGVSDWGNFGRSFKLHIQSATHLDAVVKGDHFLDTISGRQKDIYSQLSSQISDAVERNRHILKSIADVIVLCGQQNLQSVSKVMTHLTVFGEFSSIPNLGKTSPPPPCTMLTRHEMTIVPERVINIDWGGGGKFGKRNFF